MLEYNKKDIVEGININKTKASKECDICHYWYFLDKKLNYEPLSLLKVMIIEFTFGI